MNAPAKPSIDLASLQNDLATVDMLSNPRGAGKFALLEQLLLKKDNIKLKMYQEKGHSMAHFHVDYGRQNHVASYAIDTGERIEGNLDKKYDKAIKAWTDSNRSQLNSAWDAMQAGEPESSFIQALSAMN